MSLIDKYYERPVLYDYLISIVVIAGIIFTNCRFQYIDVNINRSEEMATDLGTIGLTISGFILTLSTILMTLKSSQILNKKDLSNKNTAFEIFLSSPMYSKSIEILKHAVVSLVISSLLLYLYKSTISDDYMEYIYYFNIIVIIIILTTFLRCFYVINLILKMQSEEQS